MITIQETDSGAILSIERDGLPVMKKAFTFSKQKPEDLEVMLSVVSSHLLLGQTVSSIQKKLRS
jgi:hypothetical protein